MFINMLKAKIHQATVTEANLYYIGSITIDSNILSNVGMIANELVHVVNINNGKRIETYVIEGEAGSGVCCLNGAAARHFHSGDKIIIMSYCWLNSTESLQHKPQIVFLGENNNIYQNTTHEAANTVLNIKQSLKE